MCLLMVYVTIWLVKFFHSFSIGWSPCSDYIVSLGTCFLQV
jgi:hypothetical protein